MCYRNRHKFPNLSSRFADRLARDFKGRRWRSGNVFKTFRSSENGKNKNFIFWRLPFQQQKAFNFYPTVHQIDAKPTLIKGKNLAHMNTNNCVRCRL